MSFSRRRVVGDASKECGGAEHVLGRFILAVCFFHHPKYLKKRNFPVRVKVQYLGRPRLLHVNNF